MATPVTVPIPVEKQIQILIAIVTALLNEKESKEATFTIADMQKLQGQKLRYGSRLAGTVTAWLEPDAKPNLIVSTE